MDTIHFAGEIIDGLEDGCHPEGRNQHQKVIPHFGNAPKHNTRTPMGNWSSQSSREWSIHLLSGFVPRGFFWLSERRVQRKELCSEGKAFCRCFLNL
jgi:hypothetical protein